MDASRAAERLSSSRSSYVSSSPMGVTSRRRVAKKVETATSARLRPGRQGVRRIYRMATEKSQISVYEYLESIGVPRVNALQVQSQASEWFERRLSYAASLASGSMVGFILGLGDRHMSNILIDLTSADLLTY